MKEIIAVLVVVLAALNGGQATLGQSPEQDREQEQLVNQRLQEGMDWVARKPWPNPSHSPGWKL